MRLALNDKFCVAVNSKGELQLVKLGRFREVYDEKPMRYSAFYGAGFRILPKV